MSFIQIVMKRSLWTVLILFLFLAGALISTVVGQHFSVELDSTLESPLNPSSASTPTFHYGRALSISPGLLAVGSPLPTLFPFYTTTNVSDDHTTAHVQIYHEDEKGLWQPNVTLFAPDADLEPSFGWSLDINDNSTRLAIGAPGHTGESGKRQVGIVYLYSRPSIHETWSLVQALSPSPGQSFDAFGTTVALDDSWCIVGAVGDDRNGLRSGIVYAFSFNRTTNDWGLDYLIESPNPSPGDQFGASLTSSSFDDESTGLLIGAPGVSSEQGAVYVYRLFQDRAQLVETLAPPAGMTQDRAQFGASLAGAGETVVVGAPGMNSLSDGEPITGSGAVFVYEAGEAGYFLNAVLFPSVNETGGEFGRQVDTDGQLVVAGSSASDAQGWLSGSASAFSRSVLGVWDRLTDVLVSAPRPYDRFGSAVAVLDEHLLVGTRTTDNTTGPGLSRLFQANLTGWICGDGILALDEECDDGNTGVGDGCDESCVAETCGNGKTQSGEQCDPPGLKCDAECVRIECGNRKVQFGEECETHESACDEECQSLRCGDGVKRGNEECDSTPDCTPGCKLIVPRSWSPSEIIRLTAVIGSVAVTGLFFVFLFWRPETEKTQDVAMNKPGPVVSDSDAVDTGCPAPIVWLAESLYRDHVAWMIGMLAFGALVFTAMAFHLREAGGLGAVVDSGVDLWQPKDSDFADALGEIRDHFPQGAVPHALASMILVSKEDPGGNVLTEEHLTSLNAIQNDLISASGYAEMCFRSRLHMDCLIMTPLAYFDDTSDFKRTPDGLFGLTIDRKPTSPFGTPVWRPDVLTSPLPLASCITDEQGSFAPDATCLGPGAVPSNSETWDPRWLSSQHSTAFRLAFYRFPETDEDAMDEWTDFFMDYSPGEDSTLTVAGRIHTGRPRSDDVESASGSVPSVMLLVTVVTMVMFVFLSTGASYKFNPVTGICGLFGTTLAIAASMSLVVMAGWELNVTTVIVPVVVLSIGVDDMFLLLDAIEGDQVDSGDAVLDLLKRAGLPMLMTTLTDALAFGLGYFSFLPAVSSLGVFAASAVLLDFVYQVLWYIPCIVVFARRRKSAKDSDSPSEASNNHGTVAPKLARFVVRWSCALVVFGGLLAAFCVWQCLTMRVGLDIGDTVLESSSTATYSRVERTHFPDPVSFPATVAHINEVADRAQIPVEDAQRRLLNEFPDSLLSGVEGPGVSWIYDFAAWNEATYEEVVSPRLQFHSRLDEWLNVTQEGSTWAPDINRTATVDNTTATGNDTTVERPQYVASRHSFMSLPLSFTGWDTVDRVRQLLEFRELDGMVVWSPELLVYEGSLRTFQGLLDDMVNITLIVWIVLAVFLWNPALPWIVALCVWSVAVEALWAMKITDISLSPYTSVVLVIGLGLAMDYLSHVAGEFVSKNDVGLEERLAHAFGHVGRPLLFGVITTGLGMLCLIALGEIVVVRQFGTIVLAVQVIGLFHAFLLLPALLVAFYSIPSPTQWFQDRKAGKEVVADTEALSPGKSEDSSTSRDNEGHETNVGYAPLPTDSTSPANGAEVAVPTEVPRGSVGETDEDETEAAQVLGSDGLEGVSENEHEPEGVSETEEPEILESEGAESQSILQRASNSTESEAESDALNADPAWKDQEDGSGGDETGSREAEADGGELEVGGRV